MSISDLLLLAMGGKRKNGDSLGLRFEKRYMNHLGDKIVLQKAGADDINVDINKIIIRTKEMSDGFILAKEDYFVEGSECELISIDANGNHYVVNDTWEPDIGDSLPDRILQNTNKIAKQCFYQSVFIKYFDTGSVMLLNIDGECDFLRPDQWSNVTGFGFINNMWFTGEVKYGVHDDSRVEVKCDGVIAPSLRQHIDRSIVNKRIEGHSIEESDYSFFDMHDTILLTSKSKEDLTIPAFKILIKHSNWDQYYTYLAGDQCADGSTCIYNGVTNNGYHMLVNDTWNPVQDKLAPDRILRTTAMVPDYILEDVFVKVHENGSMTVINKDGEYADFPVGDYDRLNSVTLTNEVWYVAIMEWQEGSKPLITVKQSTPVPTLISMLK